MISAIVLAAGESRRMGVNKLLLPYGEETVISRIVRTVLSSRVDSTCVVVGHDSDRMSQELSRVPVSILRNPNYGEGMLSSIRCGLSALPLQCSGVLVVLGDQPGVSVETIDALIQSFAVSPKGIHVPVHQGSRGHPLLFSVCYKEEVLEKFNDSGLRGLLQAHPDDIAEVETPLTEVLRDMDRPEDYFKEIGFLEVRESPGRASCLKSAPPVPHVPLDL